MRPPRYPKLSSLLALVFLFSSAVPLAAAQGTQPLSSGCEQVNRIANSPGRVLSIQSGGDFFAGETFRILASNPANGATGARLVLNNVAIAEFPIGQTFAYTFPESRPYLWQIQILPFDPMAGTGPSAEVAVSCVGAPLVVFDGVELSASGTSQPVLLASEIDFSAPRAFSSSLFEIRTPIGYSFAESEVRSGRLECPGVQFTTGTLRTSAHPSNALGAVNRVGGDGDTVFFSMTAGATPFNALDTLSFDGVRTLTAPTDIDCTFSLYDQPSQAEAGGAAGRIFRSSGQYIRFAPSYDLVVRSEGAAVADVEAANGPYTAFTSAAPTNDVTLAQLGRLAYGTRQEVSNAAQPRGVDGDPITMADVLGPDTTLRVSGDFTGAADVFLSPTADCSSVALSDIDAARTGTTADFAVGSGSYPDASVCFLRGGEPIVASTYAVELRAVAASSAYTVPGRGPLVLGAIARNGAELQAPLVQMPAGWISRIVLMNAGGTARAFTWRFLPASGGSASEAGTTTTGATTGDGTIPANSTVVIRLSDLLGGFGTTPPRGTFVVTAAAPNSDIQGLYQIVNPASGTISNHVMVRPGSN